MESSDWPINRNTLNCLHAISSHKLTGLWTAVHASLVLYLTHTYTHSIEAQHAITKWHISRKLRWVVRFVYSHTHTKELLHHYYVAFPIHFRCIFIMMKTTSMGLWKLAAKHQECFSILVYFILPWLILNECPSQNDLFSISSHLNKKLISKNT